MPCIRYRCLSVCPQKCISFSTAFVCSPYARSVCLTLAVPFRSLVFLSLSGSSQFRSNYRVPLPRSHPKILLNLRISPPCLLPTFMSSAFFFAVVLLVCPFFVLSSYTLTCSSASRMFFGHCSLTCFATSGFKPWRNPYTRVLYLTNLRPLAMLPQSSGRYVHSRFLSGLC